MSSFVTYALDTTGATSPPFRVALTAPDATLEFDAAVREVHSGSSQPTDHPVEDGSTVTDHIIDQPDEIQIDGIVSNRPILILASLTAQPSIEGGDPRTRAEDAYAAIVRWRKTGATLLVATRLRNYNDMVVLSESVTRDKDSSEILDISIRLREFRKASVEQAEAPKIPKENQHQSQRDLGRKQTTPASKEIEEKSTTVFEDIAGFFGPFENF